MTETKPNTVQLRPLYKLAKTGAMQVWTIRTEGNVIVTEWGQLGGAIQVARDVVESGTNLGKRNETTPEDQAAQEAYSRWTKKKKAGGYVDSMEAAKAGQKDELVTGGVDVMLAESYADKGHKIKWPAYIQPKLDGHRMVAMIDGEGKCTLWSRTRKPINSLPHIVQALESLDLRDVVFDGEAYVHREPGQDDKGLTFEEITSFIRSSTPKAGHQVIEYHIYDVVNTAASFKLRHMQLAVLRRSTSDTQCLYVVETHKVADETEANIYYDSFVEDGYEGAILRNADAVYEGRRTVNLQKWKSMMDGEFTIVGVEAGRGKMANKGIFVCKTASGTEFRAKMKGKLDDLREYLTHPEKVIGKQLTVQYFELTADGVPRFPVGVRVREDV